MASHSVTMVAVLGGIIAAPPPADIRTRPQTAEDLPDLARLWLASYPASITADETFESAVADLAASQAGEYGPFLAAASPVAVTGDEAIVAAIQTVARASWDDTPNCPFIVELFVSPLHRGRGLGRLLLLEALSEVSRDGYTRAALRVDSGNAAALALYRGAGFVTTR